MSKKSRRDFFNNLRLSKNYASRVENRGAGVREGARPASRSNNPPKKRLENQGFSGEAAF